MDNIIKGYDFDDLLLVPRPSYVPSRTLVDLKPAGNLASLPVMSAPMKGITGEKLAKAVSHFGAFPILHRFYDSEYDWFKAIIDLKNSGLPFGISVGLDDLTSAILGADHGASLVCVDVANGYLYTVVQFVERLANTLAINYPHVRVMAGNIVTQHGAYNLREAGTSYLRVGIGSGQLCTTRNNTGIGVPQLTAISECAKIKREGVYVVADGGIRNAGDAVKALAIGADYVMLGSLFGRCIEAENNDGIIYGMASRKMQEEYYHGVKSVEGIEKVIQQDTTVNDFLTGFTMNIRSAFTYMNASNIQELRQNAQWIEVTKGVIDNGKL